MSVWSAWVAEASPSSVVWMLSGGSLVLFVASILVLPVWIVRLPVDYFRIPKPPQRGWKRWGRLIVALLLIAIGIAMLILPGQGLLTILFGLSLLDTPRKRRLERTVLARPSVLAAMNKIRKRARVPELLPPPQRDSLGGKQ